VRIAVEQIKSGKGISNREAKAELRKRFGGEVDRRVECGDG